MRNAEIVLGVLRERGRRRAAGEDLQADLQYGTVLLAYGQIYSNKGAMTPGASGETADGMSRKRSNRSSMRCGYERYRFSPVRRIYIPKKNGKLRPLGMPAEAA